MGLSNFYMFGEHEKRAVCPVHLRLPSPLVVPYLVMFIVLQIVPILTELNINVGFANPDHGLTW